MAGAQISLLLLFFNILPKQQNILTKQSKLCELLKSVSCVLGRIKILMMHFLKFVCVKMHDFCVNAIPDISCKTLKRKKSKLKKQKPCVLPSF